MQEVRLQIQETHPVIPMIPRRSTSRRNTTPAFGTRILHLFSHSGARAGAGGGLGQRRSTLRARALPMTCVSWTSTMMMSTAAQVTVGSNRR